jgi:hypothetical protein
VEAANSDWGEMQNDKCTRASATWYERIWDNLAFHQVKDRAWLVEVTNALNQHWQQKNPRRTLTAEGELSQATMGISF